MESEWESSGLRRSAPQISKYARTIFGMVCSDTIRWYQILKQTYPVKQLRYPKILIEVKWFVVSLCPCYQMSDEKNPGWLGYIGDYTTQLYGDYNKPL